MKIRYLILLTLITSCSGFSEAGKVLRNEKIATTDEFLIEKRGPLSIPPNVMDLPKPNKGTNKNDGNSVKKTLEQNSNNNKNKSSLEKLILEEITNN